MFKRIVHFFSPSPRTDMRSRPAVADAHSEPPPRYESVCHDTDVMAVPRKQAKIRPATAPSPVMASLRAPSSSSSAPKASSSAPDAKELRAKAQENALAMLCDRARWCTSGFDTGVYAAVFEGASSSCFRCNARMVEATRVLAKERSYKLELPADVKLALVTRCYQDIAEASLRIMEHKRLDVSSLETFLLESCAKIYCREMDDPDFLRTVFAPMLERAADQGDCKLLERLESMLTRSIPKRLRSASKRPVDADTNSRENRSSVRASNY